MTTPNRALPAPPEDPRARRRTFVLWGNLTFLTGTILALLRASALFVMFGVYRHEPLALTLSRIASTLGHAVPFALLIAAMVTGVWLWMTPPRAAWMRTIAHAIALGASAFLILLVLSGWPFDDADHLVNPPDPRGRAALLRLSAVALATASLLWLITSALSRRRGLSRWLERPVTLAVTALATLLVPAGFHTLYTAVPNVRLVREVVRDVLFDKPGWTVEEQHPASAPRIDVLTPSTDYHVDGGDLPTLILPPPSRVRFTIEPSDGPVRLRGAAGVDRSVEKRLAECAVGFRVAVNGARVFDEVVQIRAGGAPEQHAWRYIGGRNGLALQPGDVVELSTSLVAPAAQRDHPPVIDAGFGGLSLERDVARTRQRASAEAPNIVLIVMDTLRADRLSSYGYPLATTPALDRLAARGVLFENAYATASWTWPATASILTGLSPEAHGVVDDDACYLSGGLETLAEVLASRGYTTAAISCNPLIVANKNFDQGFEAFDASNRDFRKSSQVLPSIRRWLRGHAPYRFFLYLHLVDPHAPHEPDASALRLVGGTRPSDFPEDAIGRYETLLWTGKGHGANGELRTDELIPREHQEWLDKSYTASVATCDRYVGLVLDELAALGLDENTVVAFTSDHGEELLDHGMLAHGQSLYEELVRVPLILAGAGIHGRGVRSHAIVSNRHLATTLARLGGAHFTRVEDPLDLARPEPASETVFFSTDHGWWNGRIERLKLFGVRSGDWVLHFAPSGRPWGAPWESDPGAGQVRLFNVRADPRQTQDRSADEPALALELRQRIVEHIQRAGEGRPARVLGAGSSTLEMLREIGYVGDDSSGDPRSRLPREKKNPH